MPCVGRCGAVGLMPPQGYARARPYLRGLLCVGLASLLDTLLRHGPHESGLIIYALAAVLASVYGNLGAALMALGLGGAIVLLQRPQAVGDAALHVGVSLVLVLLLEQLRRRERHALARLQAQRSEHDEVERLSRLYDALSRINQAAMRARTREALYEAVTRALTEHGGFLLVWIGDVDQATSRVVPQARAGSALAYLEEVEIYADRRPMGSGPSGIAARELRPYICNDFLADPVTAPWHEPARRHGIRASAVMPIRRSSQLEGLLTVYAAEPGFFKDKEIALLSDAVADLVAALDSLDREAERRRAEIRAESERLFSDAVLESLPGILYLYDEQLRFLRWNHNFLKVTGYGPDEMRHMTPLDVFDRSLHPLLRERIGEVFEQGESSLSADLLTKRGERIPYYFTGQRLNFSGTRCLVGVGIDISAQRRVENELRTAEARFHTLFDRSPVAKVVVDVDTLTVIECNTQAATQLGYTREAFIGLHYTAFDVATTPEQVAQRAEQLQRIGHVRFETIHRRRSGELREVVVHIQSVTLAGRPAAQCVFDDITEQRQAERERADYLQRLQAVSRQLLEVQETERRALARELHDSVGQELTALTLNLTMIRAALPAEAQARLAARLDDTQRLAEDSAGHLRSVMIELRPPGLDELGLLAALRDHTRRVAGRSGLQIEIRGTEPRPRFAPTVAIALFRIAQEALNNIVKHAGARRVEIALEPLADAPGRLRLGIVDDGCGFDPGQCRPSAGGGMGMTTMRERAEAIGAALTVHSAPGEGTRIGIELAAPAAVAPTADIAR